MAALLAPRLRGARPSAEMALSRLCLALPGRSSPGGCSLITVSGDPLSHTVTTLLELRDKGPQSPPALNLANVSEPSPFL